MVTRRVFLGTLAAGLLAAPLAAEGQQTDKIARIGYLLLNRAIAPNLPEAFRQGLRDLGYVEARNVVIEYRDAEGRSSGSPLLRPNWFALKVDVIVAPGPPPSE